MYTAKTFLFGFVVLVVSNYVTSQPPGLPQFFHLPNFPAFGGQGPNSANSGGAGFLAFPFNFPGLPQFPFHGHHHGPRPNSTSSENAAGPGSSSGSSASNSTADGSSSSNSTADSSSSSNSTADSSASSDRRRRSAEEQAEEAFQAPQDVAAAPSGGNSQQPQGPQNDQHHDKFLDFHFHRGRRAASDN